MDVHVGALPLILSFCDIQSNDVKKILEIRGYRDLGWEKEAFSCKYIDNCIFLLKFIDKLAYCSLKGRGGWLFSKSCALIQGSCSGKSRAIIEVGKIVPLIYLCNRTVGDTGYPGATPLIMERLMRAPNTLESKNIPFNVILYFRVVVFFATSAKFVDGYTIK